MKKLFLLTALIGLFAVGQAQQLVVTTPSTSVQSFGSYYAIGYDSINESITKQTIPSSYFVFNHQMSLAANKAITDTLVLPASPVIGQTVRVYSNKAFYHLFKTSPTALKTDTAGVQEAILIWDGVYWKFVH